MLARDRSVRFLSLPTGLLAQLLLLALFHGLLYASLLPPWGLIDEPQHVHYIQSIAEDGVSPVAGQTVLSPIIIDSLFETQRWETFHWSTPPTRDADDLGAVGQSYEAYQPPLFYLLLAPIYSLLQEGILSKVYLLRGVVVVFSLLTLLAVWHSARLLAPKNQMLPALAVLLLISLPERTFAVSRINNDVLVEVLAAVYLYQWTVAALGQLTVTRSLRLGLLLALGIYAKFSMILLAIPLLLLWWRQRQARTLTLLALLIAGLAIAPLVLHNVWRYDSITGFSTFERIYQLERPAPTWMAVGQALFALFANTWLIWWKGSEPMQNQVTLLTATVMAAVLFASFSRLISRLPSPLHVPSWSRHDFVVLGYLLAILIYALSVLAVYFRGMIPIPQGRFLLPVSVPLVLLLAYGLRRRNKGSQIAMGTGVFLLLVDALNLFGNLLPYYYYWSGIVAGELLPIRDVATFQTAWAPLYARFVSDKPLWVSAVAPWLVLPYLLLAATSLRAIWRLAVPPRQQLAVVRVHQEFSQ